MGARRCSRRLGARVSAQRLRGSAVVGGGRREKGLEQGSGGRVGLGRVQRFAVQVFNHRGAGPGWAVRTCGGRGGGTGWGRCPQGSWRQQGDEEPGGSVLEEPVGSKHGDAAGAAEGHSSGGGSWTWRVLLRSRSRPLRGSSCTRTASADVWRLRPDGKATVALPSGQWVGWRARRRPDAGGGTVKAAVMDRC